MKTIETERLILRKFKETDFADVHSYASCVENIIYMLWGPNTEEETREFIRRCIESAEKNPIKIYPYAAELKSSGKMIGACECHIGDSGICAELGWILHRDYWNKGYCTEMGTALMNFAFEELNVRRIIAYCDAENIGSYRVMEKLGMRREGLFIESRPGNKLSAEKYDDEMAYAILKSEWEMKKAGGK